MSQNHILRLDGLRAKLRYRAKFTEILLGIKNMGLVFGDAMRVSSCFLSAIILLLLGGTRYCKTWHIPRSCLSVIRYVTVNSPKIVTMDKSNNRWIRGFHWDARILWAHCKFLSRTNVLRNVKWNKYSIRAIKCVFRHASLKGVRFIALRVSSHDTKTG